MKILLATDGSDHSKLAEALLVRLPCAKNAEVVIVNVTPTPSVIGAIFQPIAESMYYQASAEVWTHLKERSASLAEEAAERLKAKGLNAIPVVLNGDPARVLLDYSNENAIDIAAMGSRGENAIAATILGSVARKMLAHSKASVLVARHDEKHDAAATIARFQSKQKLKALFADDGSSGSEAAEKFIKSLGPAAFESLVVLSIEPLILINTIYDPAIPPIVVDYSEVRAAKIASKAANELRSSADKVASAHDLGRPGSLIGEKAHSEKSDLIILGANGHGALDRLLLGSVSYEIATTAPCSVLVVRHPE